MQEKLLTFTQGGHRAAEYMLEFCIIAAGSGWNEKALNATFRKGFQEDILTEVVCNNEEATLEELTMPYTNVQLQMGALHHEYLPCLLTNHPIFLGLQWLHKHNPVLSWDNK